MSQATATAITTEAPALPELTRAGGEERLRCIVVNADCNADWLEQQYQYWAGKKKIWCTAQEGTEQGLERVNRTPECLYPGA